MKYILLLNILLVASFWSYADTIMQEEIRAGIHAIDWFVHRQKWWVSLKRIWWTHL